MDTLHLEADLAPARPIPFRELVYDQYLVKNPPNDSRGRNHIIKVSEAVEKLFPGILTTEITANHVVLLQNHLVNEVSERTGLKNSTKYCNKLVGYFRGVLIWGANPHSRKAKTLDDLSTRFVSPVLTFMLSKVPPLQPGDGRENPVRDAVPLEHIQAVLSHLPSDIGDIMKMLLLTGMRTCEGCTMRAGNIKTTRKEYAEAGYGHLYDRCNAYETGTWIYALPKHKTAKRIGGRVFPLCREARDILEKRLPADPNALIFPNSKGNPYSTNWYDILVARAITAHNLPKFTPYQLRHTYLTLTSLRHGRDVARAAAGHTTETMTAVYDHSDFDKVMTVVEEQNRLYAISKAVGDDVQTTDSLPILRIFSGD